MPWRSSAETTPVRILSYDRGLPNMSLPREVQSEPVKPQWLLDLIIEVGRVHDVVVELKH